MNQKEKVRAHPSINQREPSDEREERTNHLQIDPSPNLLLSANVGLIVFQQLIFQYGQASFRIGIDLVEDEYVEGCHSRRSLTRCDCSLL